MIFKFLGVQITSKKKASNFSGEPNMQMPKLWDEKKQSGNIYEMFSCRLEV